MRQENGDGLSGMEAGTENICGGQDGEEIMFAEREEEEEGKRRGSWNSEWKGEEKRENRTS